MLLPQTLGEVLAEIKIIGLPSLQEPGAPIAPKLTSLDAIDALATGATLARIDFGQVVLALSNARVDFGAIEWLLHPAAGKSLGATSLDAVFESVELPEPASATAAAVDTAQTPLGQRPYRVPTAGTTGGLIDTLNTHVAGEIGKLQGVVELANKITATAAGELTGALTGTLQADIKQPPVLNVTPTPEFAWHVTDASNQPVAVHVPDAAHGLHDVAPVFAFLPEFVEFVGPDLAPAERRVFCTITVKGPDGAVLDEREVGPVTIFVPQVQIPSLLVMTEHVLDENSASGGDVLVAVPMSSALNLDDLEQLVTVLEGLQTTLPRLQALLGLAFGETVSAISDVLALITSRRVTRLKTTEAPDLSAIERKPGGFLGWGYASWEDCISAIVLFGPPRRSITVHNRRNLWIGTGAIRVKVAPDRLVAVVTSLVGAAPAATPSGAAADVFGLELPTDFNDVISSFAFEPL